MPVLVCMGKGLLRRTYSKVVIMIQNNKIKEILASTLVHLVIAFYGMLVYGICYGFYYLDSSLANIIALTIVPILVELPIYFYHPLRRMIMLRMKTVIDLRSK